MLTLFSPLHHLVRNRSSWTRIYSSLADKFKQVTGTDPISLPDNKQGTSRPYPFNLVDAELTHIQLQSINGLASAHPVLPELSRNYFLEPRGQLRSAAILLFAKATNGLGERWLEKQWLAAYQASELGELLDRPLNHSGILYENNPCVADNPESFEGIFRLQQPIIDPLTPPIIPPLESLDIDVPLTIIPIQIRLAKIVEILYLNWLLYDFVSDIPLDNGMDKMVILGGDFLLGRASPAISDLGEPEVVHLFVTIIPNQVQGEILRLQLPKLGNAQEQTTYSLDDAWDLYLNATYLRTASMMGKMIRSVIILGGSRDSDFYKDLAHAYGYNLGMAHQVSPHACQKQRIFNILMPKITEDARGFEIGPSELKPGLATAPVLFAWEEYPEMQKYILRNLTADGDLEAVGTFFDLVDLNSTSFSRSLTMYRGPQQLSAHEILLAAMLRRPVTFYAFYQKTTCYMVWKHLPRW